jgi:SAM-dependent methyltransferase
MSAKRWLGSQLELPVAERAPIFDVRPSHTLCAITGATRFYGVSAVCADGLAARLHELPPPCDRKAAALISANSEDFECAQDVLRRCGYETLHRLTIDEIEIVAPTLILSSTDTSPSRAVWSPSPGLRTILPVVMCGLTVHDGPSLNTSLRALDIGAGCGRDAAYLAFCGWNVVAVDRDPLLVAKACSLGNRADQVHRWPEVNTFGSCRGRVEGVVRTFGTNLAEDAQWMKRHSSDFVVVVRFLRRGVLENLPYAVRKGGFLYYEHFVVGCERFGGPMRRAQMLEHGELAKLFSRRTGFTVLMDEEHVLADGRPVARFLARSNQDCD